LSSEHRARRSILVGGRRCGSLREAAALINIPEATLYRRLRYGEFTYHGLLIKDISSAPDENHPKRTRKAAIAFYEAVAINDDEGKLKPVYAPLKREHRRGESLLRYPLGESPLERGLSVSH